MRRIALIPVAQLEIVDLNEKILRIGHHDIPFCPAVSGGYTGIATAVSTDSTEQARQRQNAQKGFLLLE
jgi:hypothetical protein